MPLGALQHFTLEPSDLERTKDFYCDVLGLENGDRPPLGFPGYWLYSGGVATVHCWAAQAARGHRRARHQEEVQGHRPLRPHRLRRLGSRGVRKRLKSRKVKFREQIVPRTGAAQIFLYDPDGVGVELNFPPEEAKA